MLLTLGKRRDTDGVARSKQIIHLLKGKMFRA